MYRTVAASLVLILTILLSVGCSGPGRKQAVPSTLTDQAVIPGLEDVRYRVGIDTPRLMKEAVESVYKEMDQLKMASHQGQMPSAHFLAVSGGGDNGAFGAGLLNGWTAAGGAPYSSS